MAHIWSVLTVIMVLSHPICSHDKAGHWLTEARETGELWFVLGKCCVLTGRWGKECESHVVGHPPQAGSPRDWGGKCWEAGLGNTRYSVHDSCSEANCFLPDWKTLADPDEMVSTVRPLHSNFASMIKCFWVRAAFIYLYLFIYWLICSNLIVLVI